MRNQERCGTGYETDCNSRSRTYQLSDVHTYTIQDRIYVRYVCMIHVYRSTTHRMAGRRHPSPFQIAQKPPNITVDIWRFIWRFLGNLRKAMALSVAGRPNRLEYCLKNLLTERALGGPNLIFFSVYNNSEVEGGGGVNSPPVIRPRATSDY